MLIKQQISFGSVTRCCVFCTLYRKITLPFSDTAKWYLLFYKHNLYVVLNCVFTIVHAVFWRVKSSIDPVYYCLFFEMASAASWFLTIAILDPVTLVLAIYLHNKFGANQSKNGWYMPLCVFLSRRPQPSWISTSAILDRLTPLCWPHLFAYQSWCKSVKNWPRHALLSKLAALVFKKWYCGPTVTIILPISMSTHQMYSCSTRSWRK